MSAAPRVGGGLAEQVDHLRSNLKPRPRKVEAGRPRDFRQPQHAGVERPGTLDVGDDDRDVIQPLDAQIVHGC